MESICSKFISGLTEKYQNSDEELKAKFNSFIENKKGISEEELNDLKSVFPDIPESLIELLKYSNGTYYGDFEKLYCFQSDVEEGKYPYYLVNSKDMIEVLEYFQAYSH